MFGAPLQPLQAFVPWWFRVGNDSKGATSARAGGRQTTPQHHTLEVTQYNAIKALNHHTQEGDPSWGTARGQAVRHRASRGGFAGRRVGKKSCFTCQPHSLPPQTSTHIHNHSSSLKTHTHTTSPDTISSSSRREPHTNTQPTQAAMGDEDLTFDFEHQLDEATESTTALPVSGEC